MGKGNRKGGKTKWGQMLKQQGQNPFCPCFKLKKTVKETDREGVHQ